MFRRSVFAALSLLPLAIAGAGAGASAAGIALPQAAVDSGSLMKLVHSVYEAEDTLRRRGYYNLRLERETSPYSFNACKRGVRYHIHMNDYGDLVQVDPVGRCDEDDDHRYRRHPYSDRYRY